MGAHSFFRKTFKAFFAPRDVVGCDASNGEWAIDRRTHLGISDEIRTRVSGRLPGRFVTIRVERTKNGVASELFDRYDDEDADDAARCERNVVAWLSASP
jgi:hypothetical protein